MVSKIEFRPELRPGITKGARSGRIVNGHEYLLPAAETYDINLGGRQWRSVSTYSSYRDFQAAPAPEAAADYFELRGQVVRSKASPATRRSFRWQASVTVSRWMPCMTGGSYENAGIDLLNQARTVTLDFRAMKLTLDR